MYRDYPSDCVVAETLIECKVRTAEIDAQGNRTFRVDLEWWKGVQGNAHKSGMVGAALVMNAKYSNAPLVLIDLEFFLELLKSVKESPPSPTDQA